MAHELAKTLLTLPSELLTQIFSFVYPKWHLNDFDSEHRPPQTGQRRYRPKLPLFELSGHPAPHPTHPLDPLTICKALRPITKRAYYDSFTRHAHISCDMTIRAVPRLWMNLLEYIISLSIDLSWCSAYFTEDMGLWMSDLRRVKLYCYRDYCWRPQLAGITPDCLPGMLDTTEYDALFNRETTNSIVDNDGYDYLKAFPTDLNELVWCQSFDFGDDWDGVVVVEYTVPWHEELRPDFHEHWKSSRKRYVLLDENES